MSKITRLEKLWEKMTALEKELTIVEKECNNRLAKTQLCTAWEYTIETKAYIKRAINTIKREGGET